jgi:hypothetical protein
MADKKKEQHYSTRVSGIWNTRHEIFQDGEPQGTLEAKRNAFGIVVFGRYTPKKGETLEFRRDPGILRSQFSLWTVDREWLGSALRWSFFARFIDVSTGSKPLRLLPLPSFKRGWRLMAPKSGEMARFQSRPFSRGCEITIHRRMDFEQVLFAYFLGGQLLTESIWPGPPAQDSSQPATAPS